MIKKIGAFTIIFLLIVSCVVGNAEGELNSEEVISNQFKSIDFSTIEEEMKSIYEEYEIPNLTPESVWKMFKDGDKFSLKSFLSTMTNFFMKEIKQHLLFFVRIFVLTLLAVIIIKVQEAFNSTVSEIVFNIVFLTIMVFTVQSLKVGLEIASQAVTQMINFMLVLWPVLLTLMVSLGHVVSSTLFDPILVSGCHLMSQIVSFTVLPLFFTSGILQIIDHLSTEISISKLAKLVRNTGTFILGVCFTVFSGLTIVRGTAGSVADGVALRTGKFLAKGFLPIIGSMLSDAFDTVLGCSLIVKNAVGIFGLIVIFFICTLPALKIIAIVFMYKLAGAFLQPIDNNRISPLLYSVSGILTYVMVAVLTVGIMLFITLTAILISGNAIVMFR